MESQFEFEVIDLDAENNGWISIKCKVAGFWSADSITGYIQRNYYGSEKWKCSISHSSGGYDSKSGIDELDAEHNFGMACVAMAEYIKYIRDNELHRLEAGYQKAMEAAKERQRIKDEEKQKAIDADPALGMERAEAFVQALYDKAVNGPSGYAAATIMGRGVTEQHRYGNAEAYYGIRKVTFRAGGDRISKKDLLEYLAKSSERSVVL